MGWRSPEGPPAECRLPISLGAGGKRYRCGRKKQCDERPPGGGRSFAKGRHIRVPGPSLPSRMSGLIGRCLDHHRGNDGRALCRHRPRFFHVGPIAGGGPAWMPRPDRDSLPRILNCSECRLLPDGLNAGCGATISTSWPRPNSDCQTPTVSEAV
jgi:hypothetical protein